MAEGSAPPVISEQTSGDGLPQDPTTKLKLPRDASAEGLYSHPVYKQVSMANGIINKMTKDDIRRKLDEFRLDTRGHKDVLKKRLKNFLKNHKLIQAKVKRKSEPLYDYYVVIDFEATCNEYNPEGFRHEIIEFPAVLIDAHTIKAVDEFHAYVRPVINPTLTPFCTKLTGITQDQVDGAELFHTILPRMVKWMDSHHLGNGKTFALITDGPWDMSRFMFLQCQWSTILLPKWAKKWVNLRKCFCNFYRLRRAKLVSMLENLGMSFEGHQHSGLDDTRNIARIVMRMLADGAELKLNEELFRDKRQQNQAIVCPLKTVDFTNSDSDEECGTLQPGSYDQNPGECGTVDASQRSDNQHTEDCDNVVLSLGTNNSVVKSGAVTDPRRVNSVDPHSVAMNHAMEGMQNLSVNSTVQGQIEEEVEDYDDLLSYYALQRS